MTNQKLKKRHQSMRSALGPDITIRRRDVFLFYFVLGEALIRGEDDLDAAIETALDFWPSLSKSASASSRKHTSKEAR
jgi:hypothetical protein